MSGWTGIHVDDWGWSGRLRIVQDGVAVDISGYTTRQFVFRKPGGVEVTKTVSFLTDGEDAWLAYTVENGLIDTVGYWRVWAIVANVGSELTSNPVRFRVESRGS